MEMTPLSGSQVVTTEPLLAVDKTPVFAGAICEVVAAHPDGRLDLAVMDGDTMTYQSATGMLLLDVPSSIVVPRHSLMPKGELG
jgi:hypothetical protein